jgi:uncharacterized ferritin-like protein (DUF455 family)
MTLRERALELLLVCDADEKSRRTLALDLDQPTGADQPLAEPPGVPGRPERPQLVPHTSLKRGSLATRAGHAALLHAVAHIEFNAINLALDAVWRFPALPDAYYRDWAQVAREEAYHFGLVRDHLATLGYAYGDFPAHDALWRMTQRTAGDVLARMALVPRTLEARGLDASPPMQAKLQGMGDARGVEILGIILRDEIGHVAVGNRWYRWLCERAGLDPVAHYEVLTQRHEAPRLQPPFNDDARRLAGFSEEELAAMRRGD